MASLILRGNTWHLMWRWRGKLKSASTKIVHDGKFSNGEPLPPPAAKRELRKLEITLDSGHSFETKPLSQLLELVQKDYEVSGFRSLASLKSRMAHLKEWFGNLRADRINETDFLEYADFRQNQDAENATINRELEVVMRALRLGKINPLPILTKLGERTRQGFFDDAKIAAVCRHLPEYLRAPVHFGYMTGWRREEVFSLERSSVDFEAGEVRLWLNKTDEPRVFPMDVVVGLRELLLGAMTKATGHKAAAIEVVNAPRMPTLTPFVFTRTLKSGKVRRMSDFRKAWATACRKAGCPGMLFHDLRRSAGRNLELNGWPRAMIMAWMGHETEAMFHRYRIVSAADREVVSNLLAKRREASGK